MSPSQKKFKTRALFIVPCLLLATYLRTTNLYELPAFVDESIHLDWAFQFWFNLPNYPIWMDGRALLILLLSPLQPLGPAPLWLGRAVIGIISVLTCAICVAITSSLFSSRAGLVAGLIYAILPYSVFFERQILADPLMATFGSLTLLLTIRFARKPTLKRGLLITITLSAAILAKAFAVLYWPILVSAVLVLPKPAKYSHAQLIGYTLSLIFVSMILCLSVLALLVFFLGNSGRPLGTPEAEGYLLCPPLFCQGNFEAQLEALRLPLTSLIDLVTPYYGWPLVILALLAIYLNRAKTFRQSLFLGVSVATMIAGFVFTRAEITPRHLNFVVLPIVSLASHSLTEILRRIDFSPTAKVLIQLLILITVLFPVTNTLSLVYNFPNASLPDADRRGYIATTSSGSGVHEATLKILPAVANDPLPPAIIVSGIYRGRVAAYFDRTRVDVRANGEVFAADIGRWLLNGQSVYLIDQLGGNLPEGDPVDGLITEHLGRYPRMNGSREIRLRRITDTTSEFRSQYFHSLFLQPEKLIDDYQDLLKALPQDTNIVLYPPLQKSMFEGRKNIYPIGDAWSLDAIDEILSQIALNGQRFDVIFLDEAKGDPKRKIETWFNINLFKIGEQWFGPVRTMSFAGYNQTTRPIPVNIRFGENILLESIEIIDPIVKRGGTARIRLSWKAINNNPQLLKVFTHIFSDDQIIAQHDGQHMGELRPTDKWKPGEKIIDQFALLIPSNAPPGDYQIRVGLYDLHTLGRLWAQFDDCHTKEFYTGGQITIE